MTGLGSVLAHGVGSRGDLPIAFWQFAWAAVAALAISFVALAVLWKEPRLARAAVGRSVGPLNGVARLAAPVARLMALALFALCLIAAFFGRDTSSANITPVTIYVILWVGLPVLAVLFGNVWNTLSPFDTIASLWSRTPVDPVAPSADVDAPPWSWWLAPAGVLGFLVVELVHPHGSSPRVLGWAMAIYTVIMVAAAAVWGRRWLRRGESFSALFSMLAALAPVGRTTNAAGRSSLSLRSPMVGLAELRMDGPWIGVVLIMIGGTSFDGFGESEAWRDFVGREAGWPISLVGLLLSISIVWMLYEFGIRFTAQVTRSSIDEARRAFAPSLVPIMFGYTLAHYAQLLVDETQTFWFLLSDPLGEGWNIFGAATNSINFDIISVDLIAWVQVLSIVVGHIAAVLVAHDRAIERFTKRHATQSQYAMLFVMVLYSVGGLWLLLNA